MRNFLIITLILLISNVQALNQQEFITQLKNTHPFFNQQVLSTKIRQIEKQITTKNQDWIIALDSNYQNEDINNISSSAGSKLQRTSVGISANKRLVESGSDITLGHSFINRNGSIDNTSNRFSLDYRYPLLRNSGGINDQLDTDVAQILIEQNILERAEQEEDFVLDRLKRFIDLAYAQAQLLINERRAALASQELSLIREKFNASVAEKVDVLLQEDAAQAAQQQLLQAQQDLILLRHEIAAILNIDFNQAIATIDLYDTDTFNNEYTKAQLLKNARILNITELDKIISQRRLASFKNQDLAQLDFNLGLASEGESSNFSNSSNSQEPAWNVGLSLSYPLGGIESANNIKRIQVELARLEQFKQQQLIDLYIQTTTLRARLNLLTKTLKVNRKKINIAKARTIEEKKRYKRGNGDASFVISAQNNEQNVALSYAQVATDYQKSVLEYKAALDQLLP